MGISYAIATQLLIVGTLWLSILAWCQYKEIKLLSARMHFNSRVIHHMISDDIQNCYWIWKNLQKGDYFPFKGSFWSDYEISEVYAILEQRGYTFKEGQMFGPHNVKEEKIDGV